MTATQDITCALIESSRERAAATANAEERALQRAWGKYQRARQATMQRDAQGAKPRALGPHDMHVCGLYTDVGAVLDELIEHGCSIAEIRITESAAITLHRAPPRDYATGCVVARRGSRLRRIVIDDVRVEWPIEPGEDA